MFSRVPVSLVAGGRNALDMRKLLILAQRGNHKGHVAGVPAMRPMPVWHHFAAFGTIVTAMLSYPTYVLLNLDNLRPTTYQPLSEELQAELEERRQQRARGELNVLVQKV